MPEPSPEEIVADARSASETKRDSSSTSFERQGEDTSSAALAGRLASALITTFLAISAAIVFGYHLVLAAGDADTETMESSMMWSVAPVHRRAGGPLRALRSEEPDGVDSCSALLPLGRVVGPAACAAPALIRSRRR